MRCGGNQWTFRNLVRARAQLWMFPGPPFCNSRRASGAKKTWKVGDPGLLDPALHRNQETTVLHLFWHSCDFELYTGATELPYPNLQS